MSSVSEELSVWLQTVGLVLPLGHESTAADPVEADVLRELCLALDRNDHNRVVTAMSALDLLDHVRDLAYHSAAVN
jgi:hypothetical protein